MTKFPEDYYTTVVELENSFEDREFVPANPSKRHFECDFCTKGVPYQKEARVAHYMVDRLPYEASLKSKQINRAQRLALMGTYCEGCSEFMSQRLLFPCKGYTEVRILTTITEDRRHIDPEIIDASPRDKGIPWDPDEVTKRIIGSGLETMALMGGDVLMGPENIVLWFLSIAPEMDIRQLVKYDGSLNPKALGQARKIFEEFAESQISERQRGITRSEQKKEFRKRLQEDFHN